MKERNGNFMFHNVAVAIMEKSVEQRVLYVQNCVLSVFRLIEFSRGLMLSRIQEMYRR